MATVVTRTIKAAGGDYTSLAAWEAAENGDVVATDEIRVADCFDLGAMDGAVTIAGGTVDATRYLQIQAHDAHGGVWSTSVYRIGLTGDGTVIHNAQQRTRIVGLQIQTGVGSVNYGGDGVLHSFDGVAGTDVSTARVVGCIIRGTGVSYVATGQLSYGIREPFGGNIAANNIIYGFLSTVNPSYGLWNAGYAKSVYYNNTVENCTKGIVQGTIGATAYAKNNVVQLCGTCFEGSFDASSATNISDDGTHPAGKTATVAFVSTTLGSEDLHLSPSDTEAKGYGTDLSSDAIFPFSTDIDGETRTAPWDAGADQRAAAAAQALRALYEPTYDRRGWFDPTAMLAGWFDDDLAAPLQNSYSHTATGGLSSSGTAPVSRSVAISAAGGIASSGASVVARSRSVVASGGITSAGASVVSRAFGWTVSGGLQSSGAATIARARAMTAAGGLTAAGAATLAVGMSPATSGGLESGGAASVSRTRTTTAAGGIQSGGAAIVWRGFVHAPSGGLVSGGAGDVTFTPGSSAITYTHVASGGLTSDGASAVARTRVLTASGGLTASGAATVARAFAVLASGGFASSGSAVVSRQFAFTTSGGIAAAGNAIVTFTFGFVARLTIAGHVSQILIPVVVSDISPPIAVQLLDTRVAVSDVTPAVAVSELR